MVGWVRGLKVIARNGGLGPVGRACIELARAATWAPSGHRAEGLDLSILVSGMGGSGAGMGQCRRHSQPRALGAATCLPVICVISEHHPPARL